MMIPFIMEEAVALKDAMPAIKNGQPIGDGIGPMIVGANDVQALQKNLLHLKRSGQKPLLKIEIYFY